MYASRPPMFGGWISPVQSRSVIDLCPANRSGRRVKIHLQGSDQNW
jgi:hypothetical protein